MNPSNPSTPTTLIDRLTRLAWGGEARQSEDVSFSGLKCPPGAWNGRFPAGAGKDYFTSAFSSGNMSLISQPPMCSL